MRFATTAVLAAWVTGGTVSAGGTLGWALGNKLEDGTSCKTTSDYEADFDAIKEHSGSTVVRVYSTKNCDTAANILPVAKSKGFQVLLGIWVHSDAEDDASFVGDFDEAKRVLGDGSYDDHVYALTVGSESLYRGDVSGDFLAARIATVKEAFPQFKVGTADSWNMFQDGTADPVLGGAADILLVNAFSYWQGQDISNATGSFFDSIFQAYAHIEGIRGADDTTELWVGETGMVFCSVPSPLLQLFFFFFFLAFFAFFLFRRQRFFIISSVFSTSASLFFSSFSLFLSASLSIFRPLDSPAVSYLLVLFVYFFFFVLWSLSQTYQLIRPIKKKGWPSDGNNYQNAVPTLANAESFYRQAICGITTWGFNVFVFSAFDEPGKKGAVGEDGTVAAETHWGSMKADRSLKWDSGLMC